MLINEHNLINAHEGDIVAENTLLFSVQNVFLKKLNKNDSSQLEEDIINFIEKMRNSSTNRFNNLPNVTEGHDKYISHDQYTALCAFSAYFNLDYHKEFSDKIIFNTYDNISGEFNPKRIIHPRDAIYIGRINDKMWAKLCMPLLCLVTILSFIVKYKVRPTFWNWFMGGFRETRRKIVKTDGQLLTFVRYMGLKNRSKLFNITYKFCLWLAKFRFEGGMTGIFSHYFRPVDHPNNIEARQINNYTLEEE